MPRTPQVPAHAKTAPGPTDDETVSGRQTRAGAPESTRASPRADRSISDRQTRAPAPQGVNSGQRERAATRRRLIERWQATYRLDIAAPGAGDPQLSYRAPAQGRSRTPPVSGAEFRREGVLGEGGMGVVYRAQDTALGRTVALKTLRNPTADPINREAFLSEARVTAVLDHPNIVPIYRLTETPKGELELAMKIVGGLTWKQLLHPKTADEQPRAAEHTLPRRIETLLAVTNAIAFAHSRGIVHLDLKPENVMVGEFGEVLVLDWGIAIDIREVPESERLTRHRSEITDSLGTPAYMAPELAEGRGDELGPWTDIYLLGAILHELLTGRPPHRGGSILAVLLKAGEEVETEFPTDSPPELVALCRDALAVDPARRPESVEAFAGRLRQYQDHRESRVVAEAAAAALDTGREVLEQSFSESRVDIERRELYDAFARAVAGYEQALVLWPENITAQTGLQQALAQSARCAIDYGDLALARTRVEALSDPALKPSVELELQEAEAQIEAEQRSRRRMSLALSWGAALFVLSLSIGFVAVWREKGRADTAAKTAELRRKEAEARRREADRNAKNAVASEEKAKKSADEAKKQERLALERLAESQIEAGNARLARGELKMAKRSFLAAEASAAALGEDTLTARLGLWDVQRRGPPILAQWQAHKGQVSAIAISDDGELVASASGKELRVWNRESMELVRDCQFPMKDLSRGLRATILEMDFSDDRSHVVASTSACGIWILNISSGETRSIRIEPSTFRIPLGVRALSNMQTVVAAFGPKKATGLNSSNRSGLLVQVSLNDSGKTSRTEFNGYGASAALLADAAIVPTSRGPSRIDYSTQSSVSLISDDRVSCLSVSKTDNCQLCYFSEHGNNRLSVIVPGRDRVLATRDFDRLPTQFSPVFGSGALAAAFIDGSVSFLQQRTLKTVGSVSANCNGSFAASVGTPFVAGGRNNGTIFILVASAPDDRRDLPPLSAFALDLETALVAFSSRDSGTFGLHDGALGMSLARMQAADRTYALAVSTNRGLLARAGAKWIDIYSLDRLNNGPVSRFRLPKATLLRFESCGLLFGSETFVGIMRNPLDPKEFVARRLKPGFGGVLSSVHVTGSEFLIGNSFGALVPALFGKEGVKLGREIPERSRASWQISQLPIQCITALPKGRIIMGTSLGVIAAHLPTARRLNVEFPDSQHDIRDIAYSSSTNVVAVLANENVHIVDADSFRLRRTLKLRGTRAQAVACRFFGRGEDSLLILGANGAIERWEGLSSRRRKAGNVSSAEVLRRTRQWRLLLDLDRSVHEVEPETLFEAAVKVGDLRLAKDAIASVASDNVVNRLRRGMVESRLKDQAQAPTTPVAQSSGTSLALEVTANGERAYLLTTTTLTSIDLGRRGSELSVAVGRLGAVDGCLVGPGSFAIATQEGQIKVFEAGAVKRILPSPTIPFRSLTAISSDPTRRWVAACGMTSQGATVALWDWKNLEATPVSAKLAAEASSLGFSRGHRLVVLGTATNRLFLWDPKRPSITEHKTARSPATLFCALANGHGFVSGGPLQFRDLFFRLPLNFFDHASDDVLAASTLDDRFLISIDRLGVLSVHELGTGRSVCARRPGFESVRQVRATPSGIFLASTAAGETRVFRVNLDSEIEEWRSRLPKPISVFTVPDVYFPGISSARDTASVVVSGSDKVLRWVDSTSSLTQPAVASVLLSRIAIDTSGKRIMGFSPRRGLYLVDRSTAKTVSLKSKVLRVKWLDPFFYTSTSNAIQKWSSSGRRVGEAVFVDSSCQQGVRRILDFDVSPHGMAIAYTDGTWRAGAKAGMGDLVRGHKGAVTAVRIPSSGRVVTGGQDGLVKVWDLASGQLLRDSKAHNGSVHALAVSPDGRWLATGGSDRTVRVHDASTLKESWGLFAHEDVVHGIAFVNLKQFASISVDGALKFWTIQKPER